MSEHDEAADVEVVASKEDAHTPAVADDVLPETLYLMPIPNRPFFPGQVQPVGINPEQWESTLEAVGKAGHGLGSRLTRWTCPNRYAAVTRYGLCCSPAQIPRG